MARFTRLQVLNRVMDLGLVPIFFTPEIEKAKAIARAVAEAGSTVVEFTNRGDHAWEVFTALEQYCRKELPDVVLGVGSVVDAPTAALYINCGAGFVVSPVLHEDVARVCNRRKIAYCPGCGTLTEINRAEELGCEIVKIFPGGEIGGPSFVKSILAPCPWTSILPTGGVDPTEESIGAWFKAGAVCVGMGSKLITRDMVTRSDWTAVRDNVAKVLGIIRKVRSA